MRAGAIFARAVTYWTRDPRYLRQLIGAPLVPVLLWFYARDGEPLVALTFAGPIIAMVIGIVVYADISYDGTAFGTELITGASGRADRIGRSLAAAAVALPLVLLAVIVPFALSGDWDAVPRHPGHVGRHPAHLLRRVRGHLGAARGARRRLRRQPVQAGARHDLPAGHGVLRHLARGARAVGARS